MLRFLPVSMFRNAILALTLAILVCGCANVKPAEEPSHIQLVSECSRIADRSERNRCLYGDQ